MKKNYSLSKLGDKNPQKRPEVRELNRLGHLGKKCSTETRRNGGTGHNELGTFLNHVHKHDKK